MHKFDYSSKYFKYKSKYLREKYKFKNEFLNADNSKSFEIPNSKLLGLGTDAYVDSEDHKNILSKAIDIGYKLFDLAELYKNKNVIAEVINKKIKNGVINRNDIFINYKIAPVNFNSVEDMKYFMDDLDEAIRLFGYLDCFMFHNARFSNKENLDEMMNHIIKHMNNGKIFYVGLSNVQTFYAGNVACGSELQNYGVDVSFLEIKFSNVMNPTNYLSLINSCKQNKVKVFVYGALGGKMEGTCGTYILQYNIPVVEFNEIGYPNINNIYNKYNVDKFMLILAYESVKYGFIHIPTTLNINRLQTNYDNFKKAYEILKKNPNLIEDIDNDLMRIEDNLIDYYKILPNDMDDRRKLRTLNFFRYKPRLLLLEYLSEIESFSYLIDNIFTKQPFDMTTSLQYFAYISEYSLKFNYFIQLKEKIDNLVSVLKSLRMNDKILKLIKRKLFVDEFNKKYGYQFHLFIENRINKLIKILLSYKYLDLDNVYIYDKYEPDVLNSAYIYSVKNGKLIKMFFNSNDRYLRIRMSNCIHTYLLTSKYDFEISDKNNNIIGQPEGNNNLYFIINANETFDGDYILPPNSIIEAEKKINNNNFDIIILNDYWKIYFYSVINKTLIIIMIDEYYSSDNLLSNDILKLYEIIDDISNKGLNYMNNNIYLLKNNNVLELDLESQKKYVIEKNDLFVTGYQEIPNFNIIESTKHLKKFITNMEDLYLPCKDYIA